MCSFKNMWGDINRQTAIWGWRPKQANSRKLGRSARPQAVTGSQPCCGVPLYCVWFSYLIWGYISNPIYYNTLFYSIESLYLNFFSICTKEEINNNWSCKIKGYIENYTLTLFLRSRDSVVSEVDWWRQSKSLPWQ